MIARIDMTTLELVTPTLPITAGEIFCIVLVAGIIAVTTIYTIRVSNK